MAANDTSGWPRPARRDGDTGEAGVARPGEAVERPGNPSGDVGSLLDDMDEVLEENAEEIVRSYVQEGGQ